MPRDKVYKVIQEFDYSQDYIIPISPKEAECLSVLKKGQIKRRIGMKNTEIFGTIRQR